MSLEWPTMVTAFLIRLNSLFTVLIQRQILEAGAISTLLAPSFTLCFVLCVAPTNLEEIKIYRADKQAGAEMPD